MKSATVAFPVFGEIPKKARELGDAPEGLNPRQIHLAAYHEGHVCIARTLLRLINDRMLVVSDDLDNAGPADACNILAACGALEQAMAPDWLHFDHDAYIGAICRLIDAVRAYAGDEQ